MRRGFHPLGKGFGPVSYTHLPWWRGQTVQDRCYGMFTDEQKGLLATGIIKAEGNMTSGDAHLAVNFPLLLEKGLDGLRENCLLYTSRQRADEDFARAGTGNRHTGVIGIASGPH